MTPPKQFDENVQHPLRIPRIHGERRAAPVARRPEAAQLFQDDVALLLAPLPHLRHEFFPAQIAAVQFVFAQLLFHDRLGGDSGVIRAGHPERGPTFQAGAADEDVLQRVVQDVPHREHASHIGRRDDDAVRLPARVGPTRKRVGGLPGGMPPLFDFARLVALGNLGHGKMKQVKPASKEPGPNRGKRLVVFGGWNPLVVRLARQPIGV